MSNRFRWVYCQLEALQPCFPNNLRRMLEELPKSLDETYQRILKEINNANQKQAHQLLQCLAVAHRPLRVEELAEVLALDIDAGGIPTFNANWRWNDHEAAVLSACSSLVSVIIYRGSRVVQFSHFSVKEFLTSDRLVSMKDVSQFYIANEPAHAILAQACLGIFLGMDECTSEDSVQDIALLPYAYKYWIEHAQVGKVELRIKDALDCLFDLDKPHFEPLLRLGHEDRVLQHFSVPSDKHPKGVITPAAPFCVAGVMGLSGLAEWLIGPNQSQVIGFRLQGWTMLHCMVYENQIEAARILLAHGADINSRLDHATLSHIVQNTADVSSEEGVNDFIGYEKECRFTPLHIASKEGYLDMCQILLEHKADVCAHDNKGNSPLHWALSGDRLEISCLLLRYNAEVNSQNECGSTPLLIASSNGNIGLFRLLLAHNADAFVHDNRRNTPLHVAAIGGHVEVVRSLLELKADVDSLNKEGLTPLQRALKGWGKGYLDVVQLLLDYGANVNVYDNDRSRNTPLHFAASQGHLEMARRLLKLKVDVDSLNDNGLTPLQRASEGRREGYLDIMRLLLNYGANVNVHDNHRNTPLHFAVSEGHLEVARMLLEHNADVDSLNRKGLTPLCSALEYRREGCLDIVRLLLYHGANVNLHYNGRNTPLHFATSEGYLEVARMLLEHKADVNALNKKGSTPLHGAFESWRGDIVRLLLIHGADMKVHDRSGNTLLHLSALTGDLELARILLEHIAEAINSQNDNGSTAFLLALEIQNTDVAQLLLNHNADVHVHDKRSDTPLLVAVCKGHIAICRILLERNVEVNCQNDHGSTPLLLASQYGPPDLVQLLLDHNANLDLRDGDGDTPLHCAAIGGQPKVVQLLLKLKVDINSRNEEGSTPLHLASAGFGEGNPDVVQLLLDHSADIQARNLSGGTASEVACGPKWREIVQLLSEHAAE